MSTRVELQRMTQRRVVDAAADLFLVRGFAATTIRDIAESSGVSVGTVMAVGDKRSLLVRVFDEHVEAEHRGPGGADALSHRGAGASGAGTLRAETCAERLLDLVRPFVVLFTGRQDLARTYASILVSGQHASTLLTDLAARLIEDLRVVITLRGCTPVEAAPAVARGLYAAYVGVLFSWSARWSADPDEIEDELRNVFTALTRCEE